MSAAAASRRRVLLQRLRSGEHVVVRRQICVRAQLVRAVSRAAGRLRIRTAASRTSARSTVRSSARRSAQTSRRTSYSKSDITNSLAHRLGLPAEERHLQQLQLSDRAPTARRWHTSCRATPRSASPTPTARRQIYYGGWASPYSDNTDSDPLFTTSMSQGMVDRRAPGSAVQGRPDVHHHQQAFRLHRQRCVVQLRQRAGAGEHEHLGTRWTLSLQPRSGEGPIPRTDAALSLRPAPALEYVLRRRSHGLSGRLDLGSTELGGIPYFKYNRAQLEYDF